MNPKSLANLKRGYVPADPAARRARSVKAGRARAQKAMSDVERRIQREYGPSGLALYRMGKRDGSNRTDLRWRRRAGVLKGIEDWRQQQSEGK